MTKTQYPQIEFDLLSNAGINPPLTYNAYLNQHTNGVFTCVVENSLSARWIIDGQQADSIPIIIRGISVTYDVTSIAGYVVATVSIPATAINSQVIGKCRGYMTGSRFVESVETIRFNVQGNL